MDATGVPRDGDALLGDWLETICAQPGQAPTPDPHANLGPPPFPRDGMVQDATSSGLLSGGFGIVLAQEAVPGSFAPPHPLNADCSPSQPSVARAFPCVDTVPAGRERLVDAGVCSCSGAGNPSDVNLPPCWGGQLRGSVTHCTPGFLSEGGRFKNKFCYACLGGISVAKERVWLLTPELKRVLKNCKAAGFWSAVASMEFRVQPPFPTTRPLLTRLPHLAPPPSNSLPTEHTPPHLAPARPRNPGKSLDACNPRGPPNRCNHAPAGGQQHPQRRACAGHLSLATAHCRRRRAERHVGAHLRRVG